MEQLEEKKEFKEISLDGFSVTPRKFVFVELFAGWGGFSRAVQDVCGELVEVLTPLDQHGGWDIKTEAGMQQAEDMVVEADHNHMAFPCRSFSSARRSDEHGEVPVVRTLECRDGWGMDISEEGNEILKRSISLAFRGMDKGSTFAMENPEGSFAWSVTFIQKLLKSGGVELHGLDQCPYGAGSVKPAGILTTAVWMREVQGRCKQTRPHGLVGGLTGKMWDPVTGTMIWKTSKAAEYPQGLCYAWARSLWKWLHSDVGRHYMAVRTLVKVSKFQMVRLDMIKVDRHTIEMAPVALRDGQINGKKLTKMEAREEENVAAIGGLRDPRRAVAKSESLRVVGKRIRAVLEQCITDNLIAKFEENICIDDETVFACRNALAQEFKVNVNCNEVVGYQTELLEATLLAANDNNSATLPKWLRDGFPIGVSQEIQNTGVFPATDDVSAAIKASQVIGTLLEDWDGNVENYQSFYEAGPKAQSELDRLVEDGRAERVENWKQVVDLVGEDAKLTQLACIVKVKDGKEKVRLVVGMRRSGINGQMVLLERVVLPRIPDVAASCRELLKFASSYDQLEFLVCDFSDAFYTLKLHESERKWVICKGLDSSYFVMKCVCFGLACGPLLWARLASWAMRLAQSVALSHESRLQCYVDDPF